MAAADDVGRGQSKGSRLAVAYLEPFWGGSHRAVAEGWQRHSSHGVTIEHLPARFWKWRMRGAAVEFARRLATADTPFDLIWATSLLDLAHLRGLLPGAAPPGILFFHENQVAYPHRPEAQPVERDLQFAFTNLASALAADAVAFNSRFQMTAFLDGLEELLRRMPDARPLWALDQLRPRCRVLPLGVELGDIRAAAAATGDRSSATRLPTVLWNHRWEHDKDPETFFRVLLRLAGRGLEFRLRVLGENFTRVPEIFRAARRQLGERVAHWGYVEDRQAYCRQLVGADVVVSTARQENFGLSVVEAAYAGAQPLVPRRLAYPEVVPAELHDVCLYEDEADLEARLARLLAGPRSVPREVLREAFGRYDWRRRAAAFDQLAQSVSETPRLWYK